MKTITKVITKKQINKFKDVYGEYLCETKNPYIEYYFKLENCTVSIYTSNKIVFQGQDADIYSSFLDDDNRDFIIHSGSDEVGTGDFFGPIVVVASIVDQKSFEILKKYQIDDSKKLNDDKILKIVPEFIDEMLFTTLILDNKKYNEIIKTNNMNQIKAKLHNQAFLNLLKKYNRLPEKNYIDQFCDKKLYFNNYLKDTSDVFKNLIFETKAESKYLAVALASVIARYVFLKEMEKMSLKYSFPFPKGAGSKVDEMALEFKKVHSLDQMHLVCKTNFKNYLKLL